MRRHLFIQGIEILIHILQRLDMNWDINSIESLQKKNLLIEIHLVKLNLKM